MSEKAEQRAVEFARRGFAAFSSGDWDLALGTMHPEIEWHIAFPLPDLPLGKSVFTGRDEVRELWKVFTSTWETLSLAIEEVEGTASEGDVATVVARSRFRATGGSSGAEVDRVVHYVLEIDTDGGLLMKAHPFETREEALEAAGMGDAQ